eukprot:403374396
MKQELLLVHAMDYSMQTVLYFKVQIKLNRIYGFGWVMQHMQITLEQQVKQMKYQQSYKAFVKDNSMPIDYIRGRLQQTYNDIYYKKFRENNVTRVLGVWDDHDFGIQNGNKYYKNKDIVREVFLDFLDEPLHSGRRHEKNTGLYQDYMIDQMIDGVSAKIHIIILDVRYDYDPITNDRFGDAQIEWLKQVLQQPSDTTVFVSGIQVFADRKFIIEEFDWTNKKRLIVDIIRNDPLTKKNGIVFLSGDVHFAQIYHSGCASLATGYNLLEVTSSGMSHHADQVLGLGTPMLAITTAPFFIHSKIYMDMNYGFMKIRRSNHTRTCNKIMNWFNIAVPCV